MGRLIDADEFRRFAHEQLENDNHYSADDILEFIDEQPTAYDPKAVVKQLEDLPVKTTSKMVESQDVPEWFYEVKTGEFINKKDVMEIVRRGGVK